MLISHNKNIFHQDLNCSVLHGSLLHELHKHSNFLHIDISQGSVATCFWYGGTFKHAFVANLLLSLTVKKFWKSVNIWRSYGQEFSVLFFIYSQCSRPFAYAYKHVCHEAQTYCVQCVDLKTFETCSAVVITCELRHWGHCAINHYFLSVINLVTYVVAGLKVELHFVAVAYSCPLCCLVQQLESVQMQCCCFVCGHWSGVNVTQESGMHKVMAFKDLQTEADRSTQRCIISSLHRQFPAVQIFGEEVAVFTIIIQL